MSDSLFERLGGSPAVTAVASALVAKLVADVELGPFFKSTNVPDLVFGMTSFLSNAFGAHGAYTGESLRKAHAKMNITESQFNLVISYVTDVMNDLGVPAPLQTEVLGQLQATKGDILHSGRV